MRVAGIVFLAVLALVALPAREPTRDDLLLALEKKLRAANETAGPCVACVVVSRSDRYPKSAGAADAPGKLGDYTADEKKKRDPLDLSKPSNIQDHGYACGVIIDATGLILTPYHVVEGATKIYVYLPGHTGSYADIHAADARHDLAVLKLIKPPEKLTAIKFGDVQLPGVVQQQPGAGALPGKLVVLMANAYASGSVIDKPSSNLGSIVAVRWPEREAQNTGASYYTYGPRIEYDTKLDTKPGFDPKSNTDPRQNTDISGAALLNLDGEMIGLTTTHSGVVGGEGKPGLAFPVDANFRRVVEVLRRGEEVEYGYLGVTLDRFGGLTVTPAPFGPADRAGVRNGDTITHVNGTAIGTYGELLLHIGSALSGSTVKLALSPRRNIEVVLSKHPHGQPFIASVRPEPVFGLRIDYGSVIAHYQRDNDQVKRFGVPDGVSVRELVASSPAATAFKKLGEPPTRWLVTRVNGAAVATPTEFYKATKDQKSVKLTVIDPTEPEKERKEREVTLP